MWNDINYDGLITYGIKSYSTSSGYVSSMTLRNKGTGADTVLNFKRGSDISDISIIHRGGNLASAGSSTDISYSLWSKFTYFKWVRSNSSNTNMKVNFYNSTTISFNTEYTVSSYTSSESNNFIRCHISNTSTASNPSLTFYLYNTSGAH